MSILIGDNGNVLRIENIRYRRIDYLYASYGEKITVVFADIYVKVGGFSGCAQIEVWENRLRSFCEDFRQICNDYAGQIKLQEEDEDKIAMGENVELLFEALSNGYIRLRGKIETQNETSEALMFTGSKLEFSFDVPVGNAEYFISELEREDAESRLASQCATS